MNGVRFQNNSKETYKKSVLHMQICFLLIKSIVFVAVLIAIAVKHYKILFFASKFESIASSPG